MQRRVLVTDTTEPRCPSPVSVWSKRCPISNWSPLTPDGSNGQRLCAATCPVCLRIIFTSFSLCSLFNYLLYLFIFVWKKNFFLSKCFGVYLHAKQVNAINSLHFSVSFFSEWKGKITAAIKLCSHLFLLDMGGFVLPYL